MDYKEIRSRIDEMVKEMAIMEEKLADVITNAIYESAQENPNKPRRISKNIVVIHFSDLIGNPWNYEYYDWGKSAEVVLEFLKGKPAGKWKELLQGKLKSSKKNVVTFEKSIRNGWFINKYTIPVNRLFIEKIVEKL